MKLIRTLFLSSVLVLAACGGDEGGSCILNTIGSIQVCHNDWTADECVDGQHSSNSCQDNGFTKTCPADGSNSYRLPSYSC